MCCALCCVGVGGADRIARRARCVFEACDESAAIHSRYTDMAQVNGRTVRQPGQILLLQPRHVVCALLWCAAVRCCAQYVQRCCAVSLVYRLGPSRCPSVLPPFFRSAAACSCCTFVRQYDYSTKPLCHHTTIIHRAAACSCCMSSATTSGLARANSCPTLGSS